MARARKKIITIPRLIILALIVMLVTMGMWIFLRSVLVKGLITGIGNLENQGYEIAHGGLTVSGFPFSIDASTNEISVRAPVSPRPDPSKNWSVRTDKLDLNSFVFTPLSWNLQHKGQMRIDMRGPDGERYMFDVAPANVKADIAVSITGTLKSAHLDMGTANFDGLVGTPPVISKINGLTSEIKVTDNTGHIRMQAEGLRLSPKIPGMLDNILGRKLTLVELNADIGNWALLETSDAATWMASGGHIRSKHWVVNWGQADIIGDFDITFNDGLPQGKIGIRIKNPKPLLAKVVEAGLIPEKYLGTVNGLISLSESDDDGRKSIDLTIKDGVVKMGFITLFEF